MNNTISWLIGFGIGGATGFFGANFFFKKKYELEAENTIKSIRQVYASHKFNDTRKNNNVAEEKPVSAAEPKKEHVKIDYTTRSKVVMKKPEEKPVTPYVISNDEMGTDNYDVISLNYYEDGTVTDDHDEPMSDDEIESAIGTNAIKHLEQASISSIVVRNEKRRTDYEVATVLGNYEEDE